MSLRNVAMIAKGNRPVRLDFIPHETLKQTLALYEQNNLIVFLCSRFDLHSVCQVISRYFIGTWTDGRTIFWQIDSMGRVRSGKLIHYDAGTGKRIKGLNTSWVHSELKLTGELPQGFSLRQCFFGEHLLARQIEKAVCIVESEKTAVVARLFMPSFVWLSTGGSGNLSLSRLRVLKGRRVALYPDSSQFGRWSAKAEEARRLLGLDVHVSELLERRLTEKQKQEDYDIADFLLVNQIRKDE